MEIHISRNGQKFGPYTVDEVKHYLASGQIQATDLGWHHGAVGWMPIRQLMDSLHSTNDKEDFNDNDSTASFPVGVLVTLFVILIGLSIGAVTLLILTQPTKNQANQATANKSDVQLHATAESTIDGLVITNNDKISRTQVLNGHGPTRLTSLFCVSPK